VESITQTTPSPTLPQQLPQTMPQSTGLDLKDIHLPEQISDFPVAMGWWILLAIIIFCVIYSAVKYRSYLKLRINQQQAIKQMQQNPSIDETIRILKWAAMQYFPRNQIANLYGENFQLYLSNKLSVTQQTQFDALSTPAFNNLYRHNITQDHININSNEELNQASILWLKNALPPNKKLNLGAEQ